MKKKGNVAFTPELVESLKEGQVFVLGRRVNYFKPFEVIASIVFVATLLLACGQVKKEAPQDEEEEMEEVDATTDIEEEKLQEEESEKGNESVNNDQSLNDIRFANFEAKDWLDNEYIRTLRRYLNDFQKRNIEDDILEPYRNETKGKFIIYNVQPYIGGGLLIHFVFIDHPENIFWAHVYSDVDVEAEKVTGYHVNNVDMEKEKNSATKEEMLQVIKEHPELKLW